MIFKTINSSVDETRKTLALFNKDWNTYKTNWQQGFSQNGFAGGVKSIFQSSSQNSVISKEQVQILRNWNNAVAYGCTNQETFNRIIANADDNTKMYFAGLNKGKGSIEGLKNAQNDAKQSTIGLTIAHTALNMAISMGLMAAISLAIKGFDKLINSAKRASEAADEAFSDTNEKVQQNKDEAKSLDELISKYKELKESGNLDIDGRKEVKELQNDIADLVGTQAKNLDLVNGKLDDEIKKLDEISAKEAKRAYETATANYNNSQKSSANATGDDSFLFIDGWDYVGKREKEAEEILKSSGFENNLSNSRLFWYSNLQVTANYDNDFKELKGAQEKADYLQSMIDVLEQNGQRATDLYAGLIKQRDDYLKYIDNQQNAANSLVNSWLTYSQFSNEELSKINVDSVESFETYRQKMIDEAKKDESICKVLADGTLSEEDLENSVNDFMATATQFSTWYEQWIGNVQGSTSNNETDIFTLTEEQSKGIDDYQSRLSTLKETLAELSRTGSVDNLTDLQQKFPELINTTDSLDVALMKLIDGSFDELMKNLGSNVPDNLRQELKKLHDEALEAGNGILSLSDALNNLQTNGDFLGKLRDRMGASDFVGFTASELQEMISKFPQMENAVNTYLARLISAEDVYAELQNYYEIDKQNFITSNQAKMYENDIFYQSSMEANADRINQLAEKYNADFTNFKTVAQAKAAVEKQLLADSSGEWSKYYKVVLGEDGIYKTQALYDEDSYDKQNDQFFIDMMDKATELDQFYKELAESFQVPALIKVDDTSLKNLGIGVKDATKKEEEKKEAEKVDKFEKQYSWIEKLLTKLSKITEKWQKTSEKFFLWWKANAAIDKAIKSNRKEIHANYDAVDYYQKKANKVGLSKKYRDLVENGAIKIQDIKNEGLANKIDQYTEWYEKIQDCKDAIEEAYDKERDLIRQKLDNILTYYETIEQYYDSIAGKFDAMTSLRESKGQKQSLTDLLAEFQNAADQSDKKQEMADAYKYEYNTSESAEYYQNQLDSINKNLEATAHYKKLLSDIAKLEAKQAKQEAKGKSLSKSDAKKLKQYYALRESLEKNATAQTIQNYMDIYNKWYKLQQKIDSGKKLSTNERKNYNAYTQQLDDYAKAKSEETTLLQNQVDEAIAKTNGTSEKSATDAYENTAQELRESYAKQIDDVDGGLEDSATYQKLVARIDNKRAELDKLNAISEDKLTKKQKKRIETLQSELSVLEDQRNALDKGASADNVAEYLKVYQQWKKLDDKLKSGKTLTNAQTDNYDKWKAQLDAWTKAKQESITLLNSEMQDALEKLALEKQTQMNENAAEVAEAQAKVYELAKQVAEFNVDNIEQEIDLLDSLVSAAKSYIDLYQTMSKEKLIVAGVIDEDDTRSLTDILASQYDDAITSTDEKKKKLIDQQKEYEDLISAAESNDWDSLFAKYGNDNETVNKLKQLLEDNNWDGNTWVSEWETALAEVNQEIIDCINADQELKDGLREDVYLSGIREAIKQLGYLQSTLSSLVGLVNDDWIFDDNGNLTDYGTAKVGLLVEQMEHAKQEASKYAQEINVIMSMKDSYASDKAYQEALETARQNYFTSLKDVQSYQDSLVDIMRKSDEAIVNSLKEVIEARKEALAKKKELAEYGKNVKASQDEIDSIEAQIDALKSLSGAMDAATKAKMAQLEADLKEKKDELQETKDEHTYNLQVDALDELLASLKDMAGSVDKSLESYIEAINAAMGVYEENKSFLDKWSNSLISTIVTMGGSIGSIADLNLDLQSSTDSNETTVSAPSVSVVNSDTVSAIEKTSAETQDVLLKIKEAIDKGLLVKITDPLTTFNPEMMNYLQTYVPQVAINVNQTIPDLIRERNVQPVVNIHYDCLLKVEGNVDENVAKLLPSQLKQASEYTKRDIYNEISKLR